MSRRLFFLNYFSRINVCDQIFSYGKILIIVLPYDYLLVFRVGTQMIIPLLTRYSLKMIIIIISFGNPIIQPILIILMNLSGHRRRLLFKERNFVLFFVEAESFLLFRFHDITRVKTTCDTGIKLFRQLLLLHMEGRINQLMLFFMR